MVSATTIFVCVPMQLTRPPSTFREPQFNVIFSSLHDSCAMDLGNAQLVGDLYSDLFAFIIFVLFCFIQNVKCLLRFRRGGRLCGKKDGQQAKSHVFSSE